MIGKGPRELFCYDRNTLFLDWGSGYMSLCHLTVLFQTYAFYLTQSISQLKKKKREYWEENTGQ